MFETPSMEFFSGSFTLAVGRTIRVHHHSLKRLPANVRFPPKTDSRLVDASLVLLSWLPKRGWWKPCAVQCPVGLLGRIGPMF